MPELNSSVSLTTTLPSTKGYTLDTIVTNGSTAEFSQDGKFKLLATSASAYDVSSHQYVTTYGLALTNTSTNSSVTLASGSGTSYAYTSLSNFTVASDIFYIASYMKGGNQLAFRVFDDTGATIIAETVVDSGTKIDSVYYDGLGALVLAYNNNTEYATLSISDPDAPVATHDAATMKQDAMLTVDVLANDTDPNGDELFITSAEVVSGAAEVAVVKGKVTVDHTGTKRWYNETAQVEIRYVISDGTHSSTGNLTVTVTDPFNHITGDETSQRIDGKNGRDYVLAGAGDDHVNGDDASDILFGEDGNDDLFGNDGNDIILGGNGRNTLHGGAGNDTLVGGAVVGNECSGDAGDDTIINGPGGGICAGGEGDDKIYDVAGTGRGLYVGGDGADSFYFFLGSGIDEIKNFDLEDTLKIDVQAAENMQFSRSRGEVSVKFADGSAVDVFFTNWDDAKSDGWYKIGDYKVPTDAHHLY